MCRYLTLKDAEDERSEKMRNCILFLLLLLMSPLVFANEIEGAFGFYLGERLKFNNPNPDSNGRIYVIPKNKVEFFSEYWVKLVPSTNQVSAIGARGYFPVKESPKRIFGKVMYESERCEEKYRELSRILHTKYADSEGTVKKLWRSMTNDDWYELHNSAKFNKNGRSFSLYCESHKGELGVAYWDNGLNEKTKEEREATKFKKYGADAL